MNVNSQMVLNYKMNMNHMNVNMNNQMNMNNNMNMYMNNVNNQMNIYYQMNICNLFNNKNLNNQNMNNNLFPQNFNNSKNNKIINLNKNIMREEILPRDKEITFENPFPNEKQSKIVNVIFDSNTGSKIVIPFPINKTFSELINYYTQKMKINKNLLNNSILFIYCGRILDIKDKSQLKYEGTMTIIVLDTYYVVGG